MAPKENSTLLSEIFEVLTSTKSNKYTKLLEIIVNETMKIEREHALQAKSYERTEQRRGHANGYKNKTLLLANGKVLLKIPQVRGGLEFYPSCIEKGIRSERALKCAIAEMYVQGVSTRKVSAIVEILCGQEVSSTQVSRCAKVLDEEIQKWKNEPISRMRYLTLDATYQHVRMDGITRKAAILVAIGVDYTGRRQVLDVDVACSEAGIHWKTFLERLSVRGLSGLQMITSDDHKGLKKALDEVFTGVLWQRCQFHLQQNAHAYITKKDDQKEVHEDIRSVFAAADSQHAQERLQEIVEKWQGRQSKFAQWAEENIPEGFAVFMLPKSHQKFLRTTNVAERQMREIKRRTRVVGIFPNTQSILRLVGSLLIEQNEQWRTGKRYIPKEPENPVNKHPSQIYRKDVA